MEQWKIDKVLNLLNEEYDTTVDKFVEKRDWEIESNLVANGLSNTLSDEEKVEMKNKLKSLEHHRDNRDPVDYGVELMLNWLLEDIVADLLNEDEHLSVQLSGKDKNREFLRNPNADPDLQVELDGNTYHLEVTTSYSNFWKNRGLIDLRDEKHSRAKEAENSLILGIDFSDHTIFVSEPQHMDGFFTEEHPKWNKSAYRTYISSVSFNDFEKMNDEVKKSAIIME